MNMYENDCWRHKWPETYVESQKEQLATTGANGGRAPALIIITTLERTPLLPRCAGGYCLCLVDLSCALVRLI